MQQKFNNNDFNNFKKYFNIKETPWERDIIYTKKAQKYLNYLKFLPWLRLAWVWNSTSMNYWKKQSDIDLFLVFEENMMWFWRIFITIYFKILWLKKDKNNHEWRFCLSFFATTKWLDFSSFKIENDIYLYFWILYFKPIIDINNTYELFIKSNNSWADFSEYQYLIEENKSYIIFKKNNFKTNFKIIFEFYDKILKNIFLPKTYKSFERLNKPYWIIIRDDLLKFHDDDKRIEIRDFLTKK